MYSEYRYTDDYSEFDFISIGKKGAIAKKITFTSIEFDNVYSLAFGDVDENGELDDYIVSDNGDRNKILATIFSVVDLYTKKYPERWIAFRGSTKERTRLYRIAIGLNLEELCQIFEIYIYTDKGLKPFCKNMEANVVVIKRKND
jgi:hypothetical protein